MISLLFLSLFILGISFWMWMLADCATNQSDRSNDRLIWTLIILIVNVFGALHYWKVRRPQRLAEANRCLTQEPDHRQGWGNSVIRPSDLDEELPCRFLTSGLVPALGCKDYPARLR